MAYAVPKPNGNGDYFTVEKASDGYYHIYRFDTNARASYEALIGEFWDKVKFADFDKAVQFLEKHLEEVH